MAAPSVGAVPLGGEAFQPFVYAPPENPSQLTQFQILGTDAQLLQVVLAPGGSVRAEPGAICFMADHVDVQTRLEGGILGVIGRFFAGEGVWQNTLVNKGSAPAYVAFHPPAFAKVVPLDLARLGGSIVCQQDSYLASLGDVSVSAVLARWFSAGLFGAFPRARLIQRGEGLLLQRLSGQGLAFISASGTLVQKQLAAGESVVVDAGCLVAFQPSVDFKVRYVGSVRRALFGGEGLFYATLTGPGLVLLQSVRERGGSRGQGGGGGGAGAGSNRRSTAGFWKFLFALLAFCVPLMLTMALLLIDYLDGELGNLVQAGGGAAGAGAAAAAGGGRVQGGGNGGGGAGGNNRRWEF